MKRHLRLLSAAILLAAGVASIPPASAQDAVTVATDATFPPFESIDSSGKVVGYDIDLMNAVCDAAKLKCNISNAAWEGMIPGLIAGKYDALISQLTVTDARRKILAFSDIYDHPVFRFVGKQGVNYDFTPDGMKGKAIAVQTGTPMDAFVTKTFPQADIKRYTSGSAPYLELKSGRAELFMSYEAQITHAFLNGDDGKGFALVGPRYTGKDAPEFGEGVAIAINKRNADLLKSVNEGLAKVRESGALDALNAKYFGTH